MIYPWNAYKFSISEITETLKSAPAKSFGTVRKKIINRKWWYSLSLSLSLSLFLSLSLSLSLSFFIHEIFRVQKNSETQKGSPSKKFGTVRQNISDRKSWYTHIMLEIFDARN